MNRGAPCKKRRRRAGWVLTFPDAASIIICAVVRPWRNRQTRTFEGRMGDRMGSSPIGRTKPEQVMYGLLRLFYQVGVCSRRCSSFSANGHARLTWWSARALAAARCGSTVCWQKRPSRCGRHRFNRQIQWNTGRASEPMSLMPTVFCCKGFDIICVHSFIYLLCYFKEGKL